MIFNRSNTKTCFQSLLIWVGFLHTFHFKLLSFGVLVLILASLIVDFLFVIIGSAFIRPETFPQVWLQILCGPYPNCTYGFDSPITLWKVVVRVHVDCICLLKPIDWFYSLKNSLKLFTQAYFCWLLTCLYWIY